jgi:hypothetical protein
MMLVGSPVLSMKRLRVSRIRDSKKITNTFLRKVSSFYLGNSGNLIDSRAENWSLRRNFLTFTSLRCARGWMRPWKNFCSSTSNIFFLPL